MTNVLLPSVGASPSLDLAWRYDDAWVWDPSAQPADPALLADLGLQEFAPSGVEAAQGKGSWIWKAVKFGWKHAGKFNDPRVQVAIWLTKQGWQKIQEQSVTQRARMDKIEHDRRVLIDLLEVRRDRLNKGSESSRRKARQYYSTLDDLIRLNS